MSTADKQAIGARLHAEREAPPRRSREKWAILLRAAAGPDTPNLPSVESLADMIKQWERGTHVPGPIYRPLYARVTGKSEAEGHLADADFVEAVRRTNQDLVRLDALWGGHAVFPLALRAFRTANHILGAGTYEQKVERDLMAAAGEAGEITAWLAYDADRQAQSRQIVHEALMLSRHAGDRDMELFELTHLAMQSLHLHRPAEALRIATGVLDEDLPPRVAAIFEIRHGQALAQLNNEERALASFDKAKSALLGSITPRDPHWTWWVNETELTRHKATALTQLGQWGRAVPLHERVVEDCRGQFLYGKLDLAQLLNALVHVRDWHRAEEIISVIAGVVDSMSRGRTANLLRKIFDQIGRTDDAPSTVSDAASELSRLLPSAAQSH
ncbi:hypothetical protein [Actinomadura rudentiformis]|uniref:XRE family transcriptional regulator n=1 Tax=Actinomadura rudentiformis TaxID=359158 RepID=A0A6H9YDA3_9ACTN|nr:hypothetical protein [Actinomadura rudentiformis]KAB2342158.1 hypothetical protein F8566_39550 [Actinomadura rudentiformis]